MDPGNKCRDDKGASGDDTSASLAPKPIIASGGLGGYVRRMAAIDDIKSDFALLDDWEDRYRYLIELGRALPALPETLKTDANKVRGCASQVWLATEAQTQDGESTLALQGSSDALIVQGLIAVLFAIYRGRALRDIGEIDAGKVFEELGLGEHLTPQRSNGFAAMVQRLRADAEKALAAA